MYYVVVVAHADVSGCCLVFYHGLSKRKLPVVVIFIYV